MMERDAERKRCEGDTAIEWNLRSLGMQRSMCKTTKSEGPEQVNTEYRKSYQHFNKIFELSKIFSFGD